MYRVICGFSGIGKSTLSSLGGEYVDFESSLFDRERFPVNYIDSLCILMNTDIQIGRGDRTYLLSCHDSVRRELKKRNIPYIIVMPDEDMRNEYVKRWFKRGSSIEFISKMYNDWHNMIKSCIDDGSPVIFLGEREYLADLFIHKDSI